MKLTALCVGQATVEFLGAMPRYPSQPGDSHELSAFALQGGGAAANAAATLARLGADARFAGALPDDFLGDFAAASLSEAGVSLRYLRRRPGGVAPAAFIALDQARAKRTVFFTRGDCEGLAHDELPASALDGLDLLLVDGAWPLMQRDLALEARSRGAKTLLCAHAMEPGLTELAAVCDAVIAGEGFSRELAPLVTESLEQILSLGPSCAVITLGEEGSVGQERGAAPIRVEAVPVPLIDPTGAGDVFRGAFAYSWVLGASLKERLRFAAAAAGLKCQSYGARAGIPDLAAVEASLGR